MFWKKQQPALRMVKGEFISHHSAALDVIDGGWARERKYVIWNGELISIKFEGFGIIDVVKYPEEGLQSRASLHIKHYNDHGLMTLDCSKFYRDFMYLDDLEFEVRTVITPYVTAHGIDPQSYSLDELRLVGIGMYNGWELRKNIEARKSFDAALRAAETAINRFARAKRGDL